MTRTPSPVIVLAALTAVVLLLSTHGKAAVAAPGGALVPSVASRLQASESCDHRPCASPAAVLTRLSYRRDRLLRPRPLPPKRAVVAPVRRLAGLIVPRLRSALADLPILPSLPLLARFCAYPRGP